MKLSQAFRTNQRQQLLESSRVQRLTLRNRDVRTADDNDYKGMTKGAFTPDTCCRIQLYIPD